LLSRNRGNKIQEKKTKNNMGKRALHGEFPLQIRICLLIDYQLKSTHFRRGCQTLLTGRNHYQED
jgi:hypothetical protein